MPHAETQTSCPTWHTNRNRKQLSPHHHSQRQHLKMMMMRMMSLALAQCLFPPLSSSASNSHKVLHARSQADDSCNAGSLSHFQDSNTNSRKSPLVQVCCSLSFAPKLVSEPMGTKPRRHNYNYEIVTSRAPSTFHDKTGWTQLCTQPYIQRRKPCRSCMSATNPSNRRLLVARARTPDSHANFARIVLSISVRLHGARVGFG